MTASRLINQLSLEPLEGEGGYYRRVHLDDQQIETLRLGPFLKEHLPLCSVIYYLVTPESFSALHWLTGTEVWTWIAGDPLEQVIIHPDRRIESRRIGLFDQCQPVSVVPRGCWQATRLAIEHEHGYGLCSTVMCPAYDERDFRLATPQLLDGFDEQEVGLLSRFMPGQEVSP